MEGNNPVTFDNSRRNFLTNAGKGILAAGILNELAPTAVTAQAPATATPGGEPVPVKLKPLDAPSEVKSAEPPAPQNPDRRIGFAIVGLGHLAIEQILPAFGSAKYCKPVALVSGDQAKAVQLADQYDIAQKNIYNYQNFDDIRNNPEVQVVYIVLPNGMHEEFTVRAAKAGKHVLCEKPMSTSAASAQRMVDACNKAGKLLMIAYRIQYEPNNTMMKEWTRSKEFGKVKVIEMCNAQHIGDPTQWRLNKQLAGGGSLPDIGLYCLNTARFLTGEEPEAVMATVYSTPGDPHYREVEETVLFTLRFPGGTVVNATTTYGGHQSRRYRCLTDNGAYFGLDPAFSYSGLRNEHSQAKGKVEWKSNPNAGEKDQFAQEMDHMSQCVRQNKKPYTPGEEGVQDHKIMEAIYQSAKEGKMVNLQRITSIDTYRGTSPATQG